MCGAWRRRSISRPQVAQHRNQNSIILVPGMTFTIEPIINAGVCEAVIDPTAVGRAALLGFAPLGYLAVGAYALLGLYYESVFKADMGWYTRRRILEDAAYVGRRDIVNGILNLNKHTNHDLFDAIKNAGKNNHREILEDFLHAIDIHANIDPEMHIPIAFIRMGAHLELADLVEAKFTEWRRNHVRA